MNEIALTVFQGRAGDHNDLAIPAAKAVGAAYEARLGIKPTIIGEPEAALNGNWEPELEAAMPSLRAMSAHYEIQMKRGKGILTALSRCAVALSTLPVVAQHRPDAVIVWYDAHADLNTPETTTSGYLGGLALGGAVGLWNSGLGHSLDLYKVILVGVRDLDPPEQQLIDDGKVALIEPQDGMVDKLRAAISGRPVYVHLDCDVLNPGIVPTDYSHEGGIDLDQLNKLCTVMAESEVIGLEIAELQNAWESNGAAISPDALLDAVEPLITKMGDYSHLKQ
ncbi:arginase family protein [Phyllobacterium myrsinacearum]|uniref:Arginase family enzyme n=1 Tax=Phyllobacterium myrsinacearum TaxID=28101 RepID=A0A839EU85_9HYPH|nr:arginase family protein [Phyllobacterium myrsinacearum]MBA8880906.1 arginase family enzyme [Phyllobacterium myrsinacearum]